MSRRYRLAILSDVHYACDAERAAGDDYEYRFIKNPLVRWPVQFYRNVIWLRYPLRQNGQLDRFLAEIGPVDFAIANGDYCSNVAALGVSDDDAMQSARECLAKLRKQFGDKLRAGFGDHELGKLRLFGTRGGLRLRSRERAMNELGLLPFWRLELGNYVLLGVTSSLLALPVFYPDLLPAERAGWEKLRAEHFAEIRAAFAALQPQQRVLLFCHDPSALPFLWQDEVVRAGLPQVEQTIIGHLHSKLYFWKAKLLAGMPVLHFLGPWVRRVSRALNQARHWRSFRVRLCPSLAGIQLLNDGGYYTVELDPDAKSPANFEFHPLPR